MPYHYDPGKNIVYAHAAVQSFPLVPQYNPYFNLGEYFEYQVLFPWLVGFLHRLSSVSLVSVTSGLAVASGAALSLTVYLLSREIFNSESAALISAFLIAVSEIQVLAYVNYYPQILAMTIMPLALVFLIRHVKTGKSWYLFLVTGLSALIVLASYITAFVYFLIVLVSLVLWSIRDKKLLKTVVLLPVMTGLLLTFFWLPVLWRHGITEFMTAVGFMITSLQPAFTNNPWTFTEIITYSGGTIIALVLGIIAFFLVKKTHWDFQKFLLASWLVISFVLMESYLFRPILWVDRYFQFFDIALLIAAGIFMVVLIDRLNSLQWTGVPNKGYLLLLLLLIPLYGAVNFDTIFGKWGYDSDIAMSEYMKTLPPDSLVVAPPGIQSFWFSAISGVHVLGGESSEILKSGFLGDGDSDTIINSADVNQKMDLIRRYGVNYIVIPYHESRYLVWNPTLEKSGIDAFNDPAYFEVVKYFSDDYGSTLLLKVRENLTPRYHVEVINWYVTIAGYLISVLSFFGFAYRVEIKKRFAGISR